MRHLNKQKKFHRESGQRKALMKALVTALISYGKIKTTSAKAKALRPEMEKMITRAKVKNPHNLRLIRKTLSVGATEKLFNEVAPRFSERKGGYTRIVNLGQRKSDSSKMAQIEFV